MKTMLMLLTLLTASPALAATRLFLDNTSTLGLQRGESEIEVLVSYPGHTISGVCAIEIVADSYGRVAPIAKLKDALDFVGGFEPNEGRPVETISDKALRIELRPGGYLDGVILRTKDGTSLMATIERTLGVTRQVVVMPRSC